VSDYCQCGIPWISGDKCERCNKSINPERVNLVQSAHDQTKVQTRPTLSKPKSSELNIATDAGTDAAERVNRYGTLFEKIGSVLQILNTIGAVLLVIFLLVARPGSTYFFLGLLVIGLLWCISYLQTSLIRGLASYFQMRSLDYLERRSRNGNI
jgi:hypothetical protein